MLSCRCWCPCSSAIVTVAPSTPKTPSNVLTACCSLCTVGPCYRKKTVIDRTVVMELGSSFSSFLVKVLSCHQSPDGDRSNCHTSPLHTRPRRRRHIRAAENCTDVILYNAVLLLMPFWNTTCNLKIEYRLDSSPYLLSNVATTTKLKTT